MQATIPHVEVPGDRDNRLMARDGHCMGMSDKLAVWRFGYIFGSHLAMYSGCYITNETAFGTEYHGYLWILATRKTGKIKERFRGYATDLPKEFKRVIEWLPN